MCNQSIRPKFNFTTIYRFLKPFEKLFKLYFCQENKTWNNLLNSVPKINRLRYRFGPQVFVEEDFQFIGVLSNF